MAVKETRRVFLKGALALGASCGVVRGGAVLGASQSGDESGLAELEKGLAAPLRSEAREPAKRFLSAIGRLSVSRRRFELPENSEPCTLFRVHDSAGRLR